MAQPKNFLSANNIPRHTLIFESLLFVYLEPQRIRILIGYRSIILNISGLNRFSIAFFNWSSRLAAAVSNRIISFSQ